MDVLLLALLQWDPYMDALPGAAFREKKPKVTLTQVQRAKEDDPTIVTILDHQRKIMNSLRGSLMSQRSIRTHTYRGPLQPGLSSGHRD